MITKYNFNFKNNIIIVSNLSFSFQFQIKIKNDEFRQYVGPTPEDVYKDYNEDSYGWAVISSFTKKPQKSISVSLFEPTCLAVNAKERHSIELVVQSKSSYFDRY